MDANAGRRIIAGVEYVTAAEVHARWPDVDPNLLRVWVHRGLLDIARSPHDGRPLRLRVGNVWCNLFEWPAVVSAERRVRLESRGRPRSA